MKQAEMRGKGTGRKEVHKEEGGLTPRRQTAASHKTRDDRVPHVLLLPVALDGTVERREHATPYTKIATCDRCASLDDRHGTDQSITLHEQVSHASEVPNGK